MAASAKRRAVIRIEPCTFPGTPPEVGTLGEFGLPVASLARIVIPRSDIQAETTV